MVGRLKYMVPKAYLSHFMRHVMVMLLCHAVFWPLLTVRAISTEPTIQSESNRAKESQKGPERGKESQTKPKRAISCSSERDASFLCSFLTDSYRWSYFRYNIINASCKNRAKQGQLGPKIPT